MHAINATVFPSNRDADYLDARRAYPTLRTSEIKRGARRKQRHALRSELSALVARTIEADVEAHADHLADKLVEAPMNDFAFGDFVHVGKSVRVLSTVNYRRKKVQAFSIPVGFVSPVKVVTVTRKSPNRRIVVEQLKVSGTQHAMFC